MRGKSGSTNGADCAMRLGLRGAKRGKTKSFTFANRALELDVGDIPSSQVNRITTITYYGLDQGYIVQKKRFAGIYFLVTLLLARIKINLIGTDIIGNGGSRRICTHKPDRYGGYCYGSLPHRMRAVLIIRTGTRRRRRQRHRC